MYIIWLHSFPSLYSLSFFFSFFLSFSFSRNSLFFFTYIRTLLSHLSQSSTLPSFYLFISLHLSSSHFFTISPFMSLSMSRFLSVNLFLLYFHPLTTFHSLLTLSFHLSISHSFSLFLTPHSPSPTLSTFLSFLVKLKTSTQFQHLVAAVKIINKAADKKINSIIC